VTLAVGAREVVLARLAPEVATLWVLRAQLLLYVELCGRHDTK
jgi:hypothetical protein